MISRDILNGTLPCIGKSDARGARINAMVDIWRIGEMDDGDTLRWNRAGAAPAVPSLLAFRPRHDAWGPRRGAGRRRQGVSGQAQLRRRLASAGRRRRSRRDIPRGAASRTGRGGTDRASGEPRLHGIFFNSQCRPAITSRSMWSGISSGPRAGAQSRNRRLRLFGADAMPADTTEGTRLRIAEVLQGGCRAQRGAKACSALIESEPGFGSSFLTEFFARTGTHSARKRDRRPRACGRSSGR